MKNSSYLGSTARTASFISLAVEPRYEEFFIPQCEALMYCPEKHTCGAYPSKEEVKRLIQVGKDCCKNNPLDEFCDGDCSNCNKCK